MNWGFGESATWIGTEERTAVENARSLLFWTLHTMTLALVQFLSFPRLQNQTFL